MGKALNALIIEDSVDDAALLVRHLQRAGYDVRSERVQTAETLREALDEHAWDVILSDWSMPNFDVPTALDILTKRGLDVPFIIISGMVGEETAAAAMRAGAHDFFLKGRLARLASAIERELAEAQVRKDRRVARARLEESERRLREAVLARDEFLAIASHELKTPMTPLLLQLELALRQTSTLELAVNDGALASLRATRATIEAAQESARRMTNLVEHVLDVAKLSAGQLVLSPSKVDLNALIHDVMARYREPVRRSKSEIRVECRDSIVGFWDRRSMEKVVTNLLTNAIKFGRGNPIDVTVTHDDGSVRLVVVDRGEGMTEETQQRIFERFERAVSSEHYGGLGMGLWVVRQLVKAHGGSIRVFSVRDVGSTFTVTVPVDVTDAAHGAPASVLTAAPFLDDVGLALRDLPSEFRNGH